MINPNHGDIVFVRNEFRINDPGTYMAPFIRNFINKVDDVYHLPEIYYNHCGNICEENGVIYIYEAGWNKIKKSPEVIKTEWNNWVKARKQGHFLVKTPDFLFNTEIYRERLVRSLGKPYDFKSVIIFQPIRLLSFRKLWLGKTGEEALGSFYCNKLSAWAYGIHDWYKIDPEELFYNYPFKQTN
jgi:hypothetical protein